MAPGRTTSRDGLTATTTRPRRPSRRPRLPRGFGRRSRRPSADGDGAAPAAVVAGALAAAVFLLPLAGLLWKVPWRDVVDVLRDGQVRTSLRLSLVCSVSATIASVVLGLPLAWLLARARFPGRRLLRAAVTLPMVLPPVVGGIALLYALGRRGLVGRYLDSWLGIHLPFTTAGAVVAETFVALPFFVITVEAALRSTDRRLEDAARTLRASRTQTFWRVTLPLVRPSLVAGAVLCWARALGEFGATITFAGNFPKRTQTLPLAAYLSQEGGDQRHALVLSLVLLVAAVAVLASLRDRWLGPA
jgi:molybdate transport system permease protein